MANHDDHGHVRKQYIYKYAGKSRSRNSNCDRHLRDLAKPINTVIIPFYRESQVYLGHTSEQTLELEMVWRR